MKKELFGPFERHFCKSRSIQQWKMLCFTLTFTLVLLSYSYYNLRAFLIIMSKLKFCGIVAFPPKIFCRMGFLKFLAWVEGGALSFQDTWVEHALGWKMKIYLFTWSLNFIFFSSFLANIYLVFSFLVFSEF